MKTVYSNNEIPHLWAHATQEHARNSGESFHFRDGVLFSYREPIGRRIERKGKEPIFLFRDYHYSITTTGHQSWMRDAVPSSSLTFTVKEIGGGYRFTSSDKPDHKANLADYAERIKAAAIAAKKARSNKDWKTGVMISLVDEANLYAKTFGFKRKFVPLSDESLTALLERQQRAAVAEQKRNAKLAEEMRAQNAERIAAWIRGEAIDLGMMYHTSESYLRIEGEEVATSKGARVPLEHVRRALPIVVRLLERGEDYKANGHTIHIGNYSLDRIDEQGNVYAGCHTFRKEEVLRFAGVLAATPELAAV